MISKFSVLYVGQIALDSVGLTGTPSDERRYPNERLAEAFQTAKAVARRMDELGIPPEELQEQLRWFARDVMPAFARGR